MISRRSCSLGILFLLICEWILHLTYLYYTNTSICGRIEDMEIPKEVKQVADTLIEAGYQAYLVGGCVRDLLLGKTPKDWDITTDAVPQEIQKLFITFAGATKDNPATVYENNFGTVGIKTDSEDERLKIIEVTTFRIEGTYSDARHPDEIKFAETIEEDLARRDFTINALALAIHGTTVEINKITLVDPYGGQEDLKNNIIRAVGDPEKRFQEDALRMMRAVRFAAQLGDAHSGWTIHSATFGAIQHNAGLLEMIAKERIRDEFIKIIMTPRAAEAIMMLEDAGLLRFVMPELREGIGCGQNKHHIYTVFEHSVRALNYTAEQNYSLEVRVASLLHDVGKPRTKRGNGLNSTFHGHEVVGARMVYQMLDRLRFPREMIEWICALVRFHMFYYNVGDVSDAGVRRFVRRVGPEHIDDLLKVREADRIGSGVPKAVPYKLRHLLFMMEKVKQDPILPKMLKITGTDIMELLSLQPGRRVGHILNALLEEVLDDPTRNEKDYLMDRARALHELSDQELEELSEKAKEKKEEVEIEREEDMKREFRV